MFGLQGDPISNRKVQLDGTLICSLLGSYLRGDPANSAYVMPAFRVKQLVERIKCTNGDNGIFHGSIDANVMEVVGCLYALCMYLAVTPNLDPETAFLCARSVHMALGESLQIMHEDKKQRLHFLHPYTLFNKDYAYGVYDAFKASLHSAKDIMRELTKQIRVCRETKTLDTKIDKLDCWQAHSIYFMCSFGLCHFSGVLKSTNNLNMIPGQIESLLLIASLVPRPHKNAAETVKLFKEENTRFYLLLEHTLNMGRAMVHYCISDRTIQEIHLQKQHFIKLITNPACDYSRLKASEIKIFLGTPNQNLVEDETHLTSKRQEFYDIIIIGSEADTPSWYHHRPQKENSELERHDNFAISSNKDFEPMFSKSPARGDTRGETRGSVPGTRGDTRGETRGSVPGELKSADKPSTRGNLATGRSSPSKRSDGNSTGNEVSDDVKESNGCWRLRKYYRPAFMSTRFFRKGVTINQNLSIHDIPKRVFSKIPYDFYSAKSLSLVSLSKALRIMDSIVYHSDDMGMCPRYLNPDKGLFWACTYVIEYIYQATFYGGGFSTDERSRAKKLKSEAKLAKIETHKHFPMIKSPSPVSPVRRDIKGKKSKSPSSKDTVNLGLRLSLVAREAQAEAELDTIAAARNEKKRLENRKCFSRIKEVDEVLKEGTRVMRAVASEQSDLFADLYGEENMYSDTDDDDDYSDTDEDEIEDGTDEDATTGDGASEHTSTPGSSRKTSTNSAFNPFDVADPFMQLELMQKARLNDKGQAMDEARFEDPLQSYLSEPALHQISKFRKKLKKTGVVKARKNLIETGNRSSSVVWTMRQAKQNDSTARRINASKLDSTELALLYTEDIKKFQKERNEERLAHMQELEDVQEMEIAKTRAFKLGKVHEAREERRVRSLESAAIVSKKAEDKARAERLARQSQRLEEKLREERNRAELARLDDIAASKREKEQQMKIAQEGRAAVEAIRLREMEEAKEYREIIRRYREEFRMKQLEERRHYLENREALDAAYKAEKLNEKRKKFKEEKKLMSRRLRAGNFMQSGRDGKQGFYDDVREGPVDWVQYNDEYGRAYYYDPILNSYSYDPPQDADVHHHSVDDRRQYDAIHGEGAYDEQFWNAQMMESVNNEGGYYDKDGQWQDVNGMYTEDGTFLNFDEGYLDEQGNWILYPNVVGTLDFMV